MVLGALISMAFFFAYTAVRTAEQNIAFTCMIYFFVNIYCMFQFSGKPAISSSLVGLITLQMAHFMPTHQKVSRPLTEQLAMVSPLDATGEYPPNLCQVDKCFSLILLFPAEFHRRLTPF